MVKIIFFAAFAFYSEIISGMLQSNTENIYKRNLSLINFEENNQNKKMRLSEVNFTERIQTPEQKEASFTEENQELAMLPNQILFHDNEEQCSQEQFDKLLEEYINLDQVDQSREKLQLEAQKWILVQELKQLHKLDGKNFIEACQFGTSFPNLRKLTIDINDCSDIPANEVRTPMLTELKVTGQISDENLLKKASIIYSMLNNSLRKLEIDTNNLIYFRTDRLNLRGLKEL